MNLFQSINVHNFSTLQMLLQKYQALRKLSSSTCCGRNDTEFARLLRQAFCGAALRGYKFVIIYEPLADSLSQ